MKNKLERKVLRLLLTWVLVLGGCVRAYAASYNVQVGETFTVYTTYKSYTTAILWNYDASVVEPVGYIGEAQTSVTFRAVAPSPAVGVTIQATTYYYKNGTTSSGMNRYVEHWKVFVKDNSSVSLNYSSVVMDVGESLYLTATVSSSSYSGGYTWSSSNPTVATLGGAGNRMNLYARNAGSSTITVTLDNGKSAQCYVTVRNTNPTSVSIPSSMTAYVGESSKISATLRPSNAQTTFTWYSSNSSVASVSSGSVTGKSEGTATVYVTTANGLRSNDCAVTVKYRVPTSLSLNKTAVSLPIGHSEQLTATVVPSNAKYTLAWSTDNADVVEVSSDGRITAKKQGTANIKVVTDNGYSATCTVTVPPMPEKLNLPSKVALQYGKSRTLKCTADPADAYLALQWSSNNTDVATVSQKGEVTARGAGEAVITAKAEGGLEAKCQVVVEEPKHCFIVWTKDGGRVDYLMKDHPVVTNEGENLVLTTRDIRVEYPKTNVRKFTLADTDNPRPDEPMSIPDVSSDNGFRFSDEAVSFSSLPQGSLVRIYNTSGVLIGRVKADESGSASINLSDLPQGVYIIKTENITHKIIKE